MTKPKAISMHIYTPIPKSHSTIWIKLWGIQMKTHLWGWMKICMKTNCLRICIKLGLTQTVFLPSAEYSKRVYQGVRVKHTVKDLLAEKRSRQTNGPRYSVSAFSSKALTFVPPCLSPHRFSPKPNSAATVDILAQEQLRGRLFFKTKKKNLFSLFTFWLVLYGPTIHGWSIDHL